MDAEDRDLVFDRLKLRPTVKAFDDYRKADYYDSKDFL